MIAIAYIAIQSVGEDLGNSAKLDDAKEHKICLDSDSWKIINYLNRNFACFPTFDGSTEPAMIIDNELLIESNTKICKSSSSEIFRTIKNYEMIKNCKNQN